MKKMNPVIHFEMPATDASRMRKFYESAFGWETTDSGPAMGHYILAHTTATDKDGMVQTPGAINGGFYERTNDPLSQYPSIVISVDDISEAMEKVKKAGGTVIGGMKGDGTPDLIPGIGLFASIIDTEGNRISILEPKGM